MGSGPDRDAVRANFRALSRAEVLEEIALRPGDWTPEAFALLADEARARGIADAEIAEAQTAAVDGGGTAPSAPEIDFPALLVSCEAKSSARDLAGMLRDKGVPALVREMEPRSCRAGGPEIGRWGVLVPGDRVDAASRIVDALLPPIRQEGGSPPSCGSCAGHDEAPEEAFSEDGDWWKVDAGVPLEGDERDR